MDPKSESWWNIHSSFHLCQVKRLDRGKHPKMFPKSIVEELISAMKELGCNVSIKDHYLHSLLDWFPENLGMLVKSEGWKM